MSHFDERSGVVYCRTEWGQWAQTIDEVFIEVDVAEGTRSRDIQCDMKHRSIVVTVSKKEILKVPYSLCVCIIIMCILMRRSFGCLVFISGKYA